MGEGCTSGPLPTSTTSSSRSSSGPGFKERCIMTYLFLARDSFWVGKDQIKFMDGAKLKFDDPELADDCQYEKLYKAIKAIILLSIKDKVQNFCEEQITEQFSLVKGKFTSGET